MKIGTEIKKIIKQKILKDLIMPEFTITKRTQRCIDYE